MDLLIYCYRMFGIPKKKKTPFLSLRYKENNKPECNSLKDQNDF